MKKYLVMGVGLLVVMLSPIAIWYIQKPISLEVAIIDKTVPDESYQEHLGINWILNHGKYVKKDGSSYLITADQDNLQVDETTKNDSSKDVPESYDDADVIYLADTSGELRKSEWEAIQKRLQQEKRSTFIVESTNFASTTSEKVQEMMTDDLQIERSGWIGRYFGELDPTINKEIPEWIFELYSEKEKQDWIYEGSGFILVQKKTKELVILTNKHVTGEIHLAFTDVGQEKFSMKKPIPYGEWFDIVRARDEQDVFATYEWNLTEAGREILKEHELPTSFAAIVGSRKGNAMSYYVAGHFTNIEKVPTFYQYKWLPIIKKMVTRLNFSDNRFYWQGSVPLIDALLKESTKPVKEMESVRKEGLHHSARVKDNSFEVLVDDEWQPITIKGVNIGMAKPGTFPGEAGITEEEYSRWFTYIGEMGANSIRVYTLHPPGFYRALKRYNEEHKEPIYVFHGIWIDEEPLEESLDAFTASSTEKFQDEMKRVVDAVHGNAKIDAQPGHASGSYNSNISRYVIGWIIGIEWYPRMVEGTNQKHAGIGDYKGQYVGTEKAEPFEYWLAEQLDVLVQYETEKYDWMRPLSFTNWPTTDLLDHPYEPLEEEDLVGVNPNVIQVKGPLTAVEQFASYHVYPYYPDFLNYDEDYLQFKDFRGEHNSYAAYLKDLHEAHSMPVLIAEFGVPASRGLTHENPFGWNQGFHSEQQQGEIVKRLYEDIIHEGMLGGLVFTWQDEWFKRTWNTANLDNPDRRPFWSNAQTNEQQFGLLSFDRHKISLDGQLEDWTDAEVLYENRQTIMRKMAVDHDERYIYIRLDIDGSMDFDETYYPMLLFDTLPGQGNTNIAGIELGEGVEFMLKFQGTSNTRLYVDEYYDLFRNVYGYQLGMIDDFNETPIKNTGLFNPIELVLNRAMTIPITNQEIPFLKYETGILKHGISNPQRSEFDSLADFYMDEINGTIEIRLPWLLLNFTDPTQREVWADLYDERKDKEIIEGVRVSALLLGEDGTVVSSFPPIQDGKVAHEATKMYTWETWDLPQKEERLKASYYILQKAFQQQ